MPYNKLFINLSCLVFTEKYGTSVFLYKPRPMGSICTKKTSVQYFSVQTSRSVNKKLVIKCRKYFLFIFLKYHRIGFFYIVWEDYSKHQFPYWQEYVLYNLFCSIFCANSAAIVNYNHLQLS